MATYELLKKEGSAKRAVFHTVHGDIQTPVFMNVGTQAAIKGGVSALDLKNVGCQIELSNTYHLHLRPGDKVVRQIFERMKAIPKSEIVNIRYREKMEERKALLKSAKSDYAKAAAELDTLRAEVIKSLRGESAFSQDLLGSLISDCETKCLEVQHTMEAAQAAYDEGQAMLDALNAQYDDIISWADMYDSASTESKKMIVSCLIRRVEVYRDYRLHIDFNIDFEQFSAGLDISAIAA